MKLQPQDLVRFGDRYAFTENENRDEQTVTLTKLQAPPLILAYGSLALADPWWPEVAPEAPLINLGIGEHPTQLSVVSMRRPGKAERDTVPCAASIGRIDQVTMWRPLVQAEKHFHLDVDSALGAFYDIEDAPTLQPQFEDAEHMKVIFDRALTDNVVTMEAVGRVVAVVFESPDGPGLYPVYAGFDKDMSAAAVLVDLRILEYASPQD